MANARGCADLGNQRRVSSRHVPMLPSDECQPWALAVGTLRVWIFQKTIRARSRSSNRRDRPSIYRTGKSWFCDSSSRSSTSETSRCLRAYASCDVLCRRRGRAETQRKLPVYSMLRFIDRSWDLVTPHLESSIFFGMSQSFLQCPGQVFAPGVVAFQYFFHPFDLEPQVFCVLVVPTSRSSDSASIDLWRWTFGVPGLGRRPSSLVKSSYSPSGSVAFASAKSKSQAQTCSKPKG